MLQLYYHCSSEAGTDEAGRGCLAGPVTAAAVILPAGFSNNLLTDSKQLTEKQRNILRPIIEREAVAYAVCHIMPDEIDQLNILTFIAVDGNKFVPYNSIPHACIVKGDGKIQTIAAASVLAKTYRDAYMEALAADYPEYHWEQNKGYPTTEHRKAIAEYGATPHHRKTFQLLPAQQLSLF